MKAHRLWKDKRRKHQNGDVFARTYTSRKHAVRFADRQRKSPVVRLARVTLVS